MDGFVGDAGASAGCYRRVASEKRRRRRRVLPSTEISKNLDCVVAGYAMRKVKDARCCVNGPGI